MPRVIVATRLVHKTNGTRLSPYSTLPYGNRTDWEFVTKGWTIVWDDGTEGTGREPFATEAEATVIKLLRRARRELRHAPGVQDHAGRKRYERRRGR
jgi:hypothetical protein